MSKALSMQIIAKCPGCGGTSLFDASAADRRKRCCTCGRLFKVPRLNELPRAVKVIKRAKNTIYVDEAGKSYG